ncbi:hypothetical protein BDE02_14G102300 [Populus trichocarpa]|nr:hypothetical protein BDE02_14G102300 [Populus trichocarpa]
MGRAPCCEKVGLKKGRWTAEEDEKLTKYIQANGEGSWRSLPKNAGLLRCGKSCRLRWINYLAADLKRGNISAEEEEIIINLHASLGNRWSLIASHLPGRTDNEIKNYWNSHLSRRIYSFRRPVNERLPLIIETAKQGMLAKSGAGRFAIKKKKISHPQKDAIRVPTKRPRKENNTGDFSNSNIEGIQLPQTPAAEKNTLSSTINDTVIWDPCAEDKELMDLVVTTPCPETGRVMLGSSGEKANLVICPGEERRRPNSIFHPSGGEKENDSFGQFCEGIESEMLSFNEVMGKELLDPDGDSSLNDEGQNGLLVHSGERQSGVSSPDKTVDVFESIGDLSSNGESCDWHSFSSISTSGFDDCGVDWSWDDVMGGHLEIGDETKEENMLSWLWENEKGEEETQRLEDVVNYEKQNAMLLGFFLDLPQ